MRRWLLLVGIAIALAGAGTWLWRAGNVADVTAVTVGRGSVAEVVYATGTVEPRRWAKVISMQRKRIVEICDCEGKRVKAGDMLARLDDVEERAALAELQARHNRLDLDTQRIKGMYDRGDDPTSAGRKAVMGALSLYLDFINMFQFLLQLMGDRRN